MDGLLIDLDGVIYVGANPVEGAAEALRWVVENNIPHLYVTNTTSAPRRSIVEKLKQYGVGTDEQHILTPAVVAKHWLSEQTSGPVALFVPECTLEDFSGVEFINADVESGAGAVVIGDLGEKWDFVTLNKAFRLLVATPTPALVALGMTRYWRADDGLRLDVAPFVKALEHATGVDAVVMGKPAKTFFDTALKIIGCAAEATVMIGDDVAGDVGAAQRAGLKGILVKTGKFRQEDLAGTITPDAVLESIESLPTWWRDNAVPRGLSE